MYIFYFYWQKFVMHNPLWSTEQQSSQVTTLLLLSLIVQRKWLVVKWIHQLNIRGQIKTQSPPLFPSLPSPQVLVTQWPDAFWTQTNLTVSSCPHKHVAELTAVWGRLEWKPWVSMYALTIQSQLHLWTHTHTHTAVAIIKLLSTSCKKLRWSCG